MSSETSGPGRGGFWARLRPRRARSVWCGGRRVGREVGRASGGEILVASGRLDPVVRRVPPDAVTEATPERLRLALDPETFERLPGYLPDPELEEAVYRSLTEFPPLRNLGLGSVRVTAREGRVTLAGHLPTDVLREEAVRRAAATWGVRSVDDQLVVDRELVVAVSRAFLGHPRLRRGGIRVQAAMGTVTLEGEVESREDAELARSLAWRLPGVVAIRDLIRVAAEPGSDVDAPAEERPRVP
jgi:hypothetical protein